MSIVCSSFVHRTKSFILVVFKMAREGDAINDVRRRLFISDIDRLRLRVSSIAFHCVLDFLLHGVFSGLCSLTVSAIGGRLKYDDSQSCDRTMRGRGNRCE
jgi:hypothetical protein